MQARPPKRGRGRPRGTGKPDGPTLRRIADTIVADPTLRPTTAIKRTVGSQTDTSTQASAQTSGPRQRIEVITGAERRRHWSWEQKQAIVAESVAPRASPTVIARKYGLNTGQLYTWRRQLLRRVPARRAGCFR